MNRNIAIDGPSGAGKSTLAKEAARRLGYTYLDTGAMYRAFGLHAIRSGIDFAEANAEEEIKRLAAHFTMEILYENGNQQVILNGDNVTDRIRTPEVSMAASIVAKIPEVRSRLVEIQRQIASRKDVVMDGRDIGSYVLKDARVKIFLTASVEVRAKRRYDELAEKGDKVTYEEVLEDMKKRDDNDRKREISPLVQAEDAILLDTSEMTREESIDALMNIINSKINGD